MIENFLTIVQTALVRTISGSGKKTNLDAVRNKLEDWNSRPSQPGAPRGPADILYYIDVMQHCNTCKYKRLDLTYQHVDGPECVRREVLRFVLHRMASIRAKEGMSPAEFLLDVVNSDFTDPSSVEGGSSPPPIYYMLCTELYICMCTAW